MTDTEQDELVSRFGRYARSLGRVIPAEQIAQLVADLDGYALDDIAAAVNQYRRVKPFFPTLSELLPYLPSPTPRAWLCPHEPPCPHTAACRVVYVREVRSGVLTRRPDARDEPIPAEWADMVHELAASLSAPTPQAEA